ncbi:MAG TPA: hypothetical protein VFP84_25580, partial [Kofleriaceae bacterium]|nr:hypothetical protein [Kofleriaceae bacterium]
TEAPRAIPPPSPAAPPPSPRRARRFVIAGVATAIALTAGALVRRGPAPTPAAVPTPVVLTPIDAAVIVDAPIAIDAPAPPRDAAIAPPDASLPAHRHVASLASPAPPPPPSPGSDPAARGYVQVVGEDLLRARVIIDGVAAGFVPNRFAVSLGHHRIEVERPDGTRLPAREIDVTTFHTAQHPARPSW